MSIAKEKSKDAKRITSAFSQMLLIITAFVIMGVASFIFVSRLEYTHLVNDSENALSVTEKEVTSILMEAETLLISYSETLRGMISYGIDADAVYDYMEYITGYLLDDSERTVNITNTHAYFYKWSDKYFYAISDDLPDDYNPVDQAWYKAALEADGEIGISIFNIASRYAILTLSRVIKDDNDEPLGVVCVDLEMFSIFNLTSTVNLTQNSYGMLLNDKLEIISHPRTYYRGTKLSNLKNGVASVVPDLERGLDIFERRVKYYSQDDLIVYFRKIKFDWHLGIIIPANEYYRSIINMVIFLTIIGSLLAAGLCVMFYYINQAKMKSDLRTQQKSNFLATMSHEIRTPLNAILGMTEIQMQITSHPPSTSEAFIKINNSGNLLLNIINDILDLSKIEAGKLELVPIKYEVANLINDTAQLNYIRYDSKPINFVLEIDEHIPSELIGDDLRIKQILNNILSNAFKYTEKGQVTFSVNAECVSKGGIVLVTLIFQVRDTGQGMSSEQVNKLFDEYSRFNLEANRTTEGAGLGMTITRNLVELMHGKISIKSAVGEGTTVTIRIPQKTEGMGIRSMLGKETVEKLRQFKHGGLLQVKKLQFSHEYMPYGRVLIVDDVETNLYVAKGLMTPYGLEIDAAESGFEAIDKVKNGKIYDIIFMDHMMPEMDGIEAARILRSMGYERPIVALTANALTGQAEVFLENGFDDFISKPIDVRHLNVVLNRLIRDRQPVEVLETARKEKEELDKKQGTTKGQTQIDSQLAVIFTRDAEKAVYVLENCLNNNLNSKEEIQSYIINVHAMKSALANIGEFELSAAALRLEQAGRNNNLNILLAETRSFLDNLQKIIEKIKPAEDNETIEESEEDLKIMREQLTIIKEACSSFDKKTAKTALNLLLEKPWSGGAKDLLNSISENLLHSEFDKAIEMIDKYLSALT